MANKFLKEVKLTSKVGTPSLIQSPLDLGAIQESTTGSKAVDIGIKIATQMANKLDESERQSELLGIQEKADQNVKDYELSWGDKDKYEINNYKTYKKGLDKVKGENKALITNTNFTNSSDVDNWNHSMNTQFSNKLFEEEGLRNVYRSKKIVGESAEHVKILQQEYANTDEEDTSALLGIKKKTFKYLNSLEGAGVPTWKVNEMKSKISTQFDIANMKTNLDTFINDPNMSINDKFDHINKLQEVFVDDMQFNVDAENMAKDGLIPNTKEAKAEYAKHAKYTIQEALGGQYGLLNSAKIKIAKNYNDKIEKANKEIQGVYTNINSGNIVHAISTLEGKPISGTELISHDITNKYYGSDMKELTKNNEYIPMLSLSEVNEFRRQNKTDVANGIPRQQSVEAILSTIDRDANGNVTDVGRMTLKQMVAGGIVSELEVDNMEHPNDFSSDIINGEAIGVANKSSNKLNTLNFRPKFILQTEKSEKGTFTYAQTVKMTEIFTGLALSNDYGATDVNGNVTPVSFQTAYDKNIEFRNKVDNIAKKLIKYHPVKTTEAKFKVKDTNIQKQIFGKYNL